MEVKRVADGSAGGQLVTVLRQATTGAYGSVYLSHRVLIKTDS